MANANAQFAALADPTRRAVFQRLRRCRLSVAEIAHGLPVSRPVLSQNFKVLKQAGLVADEAECTRRVYHIDPKGLAAIRTWLDQFWDDALAAFAAEVDRPEGKRR